MCTRARGYAHTHAYSHVANPAYWKAHSQQKGGWMERGRDAETETTAHKQVNLVIYCCDSGRQTRPLWDKYSWPSTINSLHRFKDVFLILRYVVMFCTLYWAAFLSTHLVFDPFFKVRVWKPSPLRRDLYWLKHANQQHRMNHPDV